MKNIEKYKELVIESIGQNTNCHLAKKVYGTHNCTNRHCTDCRHRVAEWLDEEYVPQIDWIKVPVDTPVIVSHICDHNNHRYFAGFKPEYNDCFVTFSDGRTSFTTDGALEHWVMCRLARPEDIEKYSI